MLNFDDKTGLLLGENSDSSQKDFSNNSSDKRKVLDYEKKINENLSVIAKKLGTKKDNKNNLNENTTANEKANKQKEDTKKEVVKQSSNSNTISKVNINTDEIGEVIGDAYYRSFEEIRNAISPFSSVFKNIKSSLTKNDKPKDEKKENIKSSLTKNDKPKTASEKALHTEKKVNLDKEILQKENDVLDTNKEILKSVKKISKKPNGSIGIAKMLLQSLSKFLPLLGIVGAIKSLGTTLRKFVKPQITKKNKTVKKKSDTLRNKKTETVKSNAKKSKTETQKTENSNKKEATKRSQKNKPKRYKRIAKVAFKKSSKAVTKAVTKIATRGIPIIGEVLLVWDGANIVKKMTDGMTFTEATKSQMLGIEPIKKVEMEKSKTFISENKKDIVSRRTHRDKTKEKEVLKTTQTKDTNYQNSISYKEDFNRVVNAINTTSKETNTILMDILSDIGNETIVYNPKRDKVDL